MGSERVEERNTAAMETGPEEAGVKEPAQVQGSNLRYCGHCDDELSYGGYDYTDDLGGQWRFCNTVCYENWRDMLDPKAKMLLTGDVPYV